MSIAPVPMTWPDTLQTALALNKDEALMQSRCQVATCPSGTCDTVLQIGIFFDGTNNNRDRDEPDRAHSNVVRLFNAHPDAITGEGSLKRVGYYRYYVPGVGTPFPENHEWRESSDGKAKGEGALERVVFGVFCVFNGIHRYLQGNQDLYSRGEVSEKLQYFHRGMLEKAVNSPTSEYVMSLEKEIDPLFNTANEKLAPIIKSSNKKNGGLSLIGVRVNVFGFSRGAAEAVAFCHYMKRAFPDHKVVGIPLNINFVGLFDCVASMGIADSSRRMISSHAFTGHGGNHDIGKWVTQSLPPIVRQAVHLVAAHEQRMNFPVDLVSGGNMQTFIYPGVHSDLGGGYGLKGQGRNPDDGTMLSQLPLMHMHKLARMNGVDLASTADIAKIGKLLKDFALDPRLPKAWNAYMAATEADFRQNGGMQTLSDCKDPARLIRQHMRMRYDQLRKYNGGEAAYDKNLLLPLAGQDQEDISSAIRLLHADLWMIQAYLKTGQYLHGENAIIYSKWYNKCNLAVSQLVHTKSDGLYVDSTWQVPEDLPWIEWAFGEVRHKHVKNPVKETGHWDLLHCYVHDSIAGFYMVGYSTAVEKAEALQSMVEKRNKGEALTEHEKTVLHNYDEKVKTDPKLKGIIQDHINGRAKVSSEVYEKQFAYKRDEANYVENSGVFPVVADKDESVMLSSQPLVNRAAVPMVTNTRREGGGYLFPRAVFVQGKPIRLIG